MHKRNALLALGVVAAIALGWGVARYMRGGQTGSPGGSADAGGPLALRLLSTPMPVKTFTATDLDGRPISTDAWRGKVTIVNFWATWCPPCRAEIPDLIALQAKYGDQLQVIGISQDETGPEVVRQFVKEQGINYPIVMSTPEIEQIFTGIYALPTSFIIDRDVQVVAKHVGMLNPAVDRRRNASARRPDRRCDGAVRRGRDQGADQGRRPGDQNTRRRSRPHVPHCEGQRAETAERRFVHVRMRPDARRLPHQRSDVQHQSAARAENRRERQVVTPRLSTRNHEAHEDTKSKYFLCTFVLRVFVVSGVQGFGNSAGSEAFAVNMHRAS